MEKIAVTSEGPDMNARVDPRFGRAAGFMIIEPDNETFEYLDNGQTQTMGQGAGIQAAEIVSRSGARVVLTGYVGPKAFQALEAAGIQVGQDLEDLTVAQALERFRAGQVALASQPNGPNRQGTGS